MRRWVLLMAAMTLALAPAGAAGAAAGTDDEPDSERSCVVLLQPTTDDATGTEDATAIDLGCYDGLVQAIEVTTGMVLPEGTTGAELTQEMLDEAAARTDAPEAAVVIGIDWVNQSYSGDHLISEAAYGCAGGVTWGTSYVTDTWNDRFESGKAYASCDRGRKFENSQYGGAQLTCTPNCSTFGVLNNEVSSLKWLD